MIYLSKSHKIGQDNAIFNESINHNFENTNKLLDIDAWLYEDAGSSMIFIFVMHNCTPGVHTSDFLVF